MRVFSIHKNSVFLFANGSMRKIPRCNVQLWSSEEEKEKSEDKDQNSEQLNQLGLPPGEKSSHSKTTGSCGDSPKETGHKSEDKDQTKCNAKSQTVNFKEESFSENMNEKEIEEIGRQRT